MNRDEAVAEAGRVAIASGYAMAVGVGLNEYEDAPDYDYGPADGFARMFPGHVVLVRIVP